MIDLVVLKDDIISGPLSSQLAQLVIDGRDSDIANELNNKIFDGYISRRHLTVCLTKFESVGGLIKWVLDSRTMPDGNPVSFSIYCLFNSINRVVTSDLDLKASIADITKGLLTADPLIKSGLVPQEFIDALNSGEIKISRAEQLFGIGTIVNHENIAKALRG